MFTHLEIRPSLYKRARESLVDIVQLFRIVRSYNRMIIP